MKKTDVKNRKKAKIADWAAEFNIPHVDIDPDLHSIRHWQSLPPNKRTGFLRVRLPNGGSSL